MSISNYFEIQSKIKDQLAGVRRISDMIKPPAYLESIQRNLDITSQMGNALPAFAQIQPSLSGLETVMQQHQALINPASGISNIAETVASLKQAVPYMGRLSEITAQTEQIKQAFDISHLLPEIPKISELNQTMLGNATLLSNTISSLSEQSSNYASQFSGIGTALQNVVNIFTERSSVLNTITNISPLLTSSFTAAVARAMPKIDVGSLDFTSKLDFGTLSFDVNAGLLSFEGEEYSIEEIENAAVQFTDNTTVTPATNRAVKLYNVISTIIALLVFLYTAPSQIADSTKWYVENVPGIIETLAIRAAHSSPALSLSVQA